MDRHLLTKKYIQEHSLVESNIFSFNNFMEEKMQQIVNELNENLPTEEAEIKLSKIRIGKPNVIEADGSVSILTPAEARLMRATSASSNPST